MTEYDDKFFRNVQEFFGEDSQWGKAAEECAELIHGIIRCQRKVQSLHSTMSTFNETSEYLELIQEVADVQIMIDQLAVLTHYASDFRSKVAKMKLLKLERLEHSMNQTLMDDVFNVRSS